MKTAFISLLIILGLLVGGGYYLFTNLDAIVQRQIEAYGTQAVGSDVSVASVDINLAAGRASIEGLTVANPEGFSDAAMLGFQELSVTLDLANLSRESIGITSIVARNPRVLYEHSGNTSNLDVVAERFARDPAATEEPAASGSDIQLVIDSIQIDDIGASVSSSRLPRVVEVGLGDISLENLSGTPTEIAEQIMRPVIEQLSRNAASAVIAAAAEVTQQELEAAGQEALQQAEDRLDEVEDSVNQRLDETIGEDLREGLGDLLQRDEPQN